MLEYLRRYASHFMHLNLHRTPRGPLIVYLELTKRCNLMCKFCDIWRWDDHQDELSTEEVFSLIDQVKDTAIVFHIFGGESLLRKDMEEIVKYANQAGLSTGITTNGTLLTPKRSQSLAHAGLKHIRISLDGTQQIHDNLRGKKCHTTIMNNIAHIQQHHPTMQVGINYMLNKKNLQNTQEFLTELNRLEIADIKITPMHTIYPFNYTGQDKSALLFHKDDIPQLQKLFLALYADRRIKTSKYFLEGFLQRLAGQRKEHICRAGDIEIDIDCTGNMYTCYGLQHPVGNIRTTSVKDIWQSRRMNRARKKVSNCTACWDDCHVDPAAVFSAKAVLSEPQKYIHEIRSVLKRS
ncbi:radical SAM protein [Candidatus Woesearchaeota archaeon]|nr:radical SAM protein [Candidatus Woesearchaeota archaeon]